SADANSYHLGATLDYSTDYYWRVDGLGAETWKGLVWKFRTRSEIVDPNLWLWYEFDEESGGKVHDSSGRDYDSRDDSANDQWDPNGGQWGGALWCDDDMGLDVTNEVLSNIKNGITVSVWLKESYRSGYNNWVFDGGNTGTHRVRAAVVAEGGEVLWRAGNDGNDTLTWDFGDIDPSRLEGWHHWAFVKDEAAKTISIYFDGELADSNNKAEPTLANVQNGDFKIAAVTNHSSDLIGWIDDFRLYDYAKSAKDVMELYRGGDLARAYKPQPFDGQPDIPRDLADVSWKPGDYAVSHDVYFGTDLQAVTDANTSEHMDVYIGNQPLADTNYIMPSELKLNQTYYWRIDEVNDSNVDSPWKGRAWSFRVANYITIEGFEDFDLLSNLINDTWLDGVRVLPVPPYFEYKNGATVTLGVSFATPPDPVHRGKQSMTFGYDNSGWGGLVPYYSEAERIFDSPQDWTEADVKILTVFFYGDPNNDANLTEQMYAAVNDGSSDKVIEYGYYADEDMSDIKKDEWQEWNMALADFGATLTNIEKMYIGFGDRDDPTEGGFGFVYFDDVRLSPRKCVPSRLKPDYDFNRDCIVDFREIDAVGTNHGQIEGDHSWVTGYDGVNSALEFDGGKVVVPDAPALRPQYELSVSAWIKHSDTPGGARVIVKGADGKETFSLEVNPDKALTFIVRDVNNKIHDLDSEEELGRNEWIHVAGTYDANVIASYVNGELKESATIGAIELSQDPNGLAMGNRAESFERPFEGALDDVRLYNYGLLASEVRYLATDGTGYVLLRSQYNIYDAELANKQAVNMRDMAFIADAWLEQKLWPPLP
ncbi:MAG: LamG domain-containing protein, partial [Planctomycetota bacterium]